MELIKMKKYLLIILLITTILTVLFFSLSCSKNISSASTQKEPDTTVTVSSETTTTTKANTPPIAVIKTNRANEANINTEFTFSSADSSDVDGDPLTFEWTLWDGTKKTSATFPFLFKEIGNYEINLIVSDGKSTAEDSVIIQIVNQPPIINLSETNISCDVGDILKLSAKGTTDLEGDNIKITWYLPDDSTLEGEEIEYTVADLGKSVIVIVATDGIDEATGNIFIEAKESEEQFKQSCLKVKYDDLLRNPDKYKGERIYIKSEIVQKISNQEFHVMITKGSYGIYDDRTWLYFESIDISLIEDDIIEVWGLGGGNQSYETVMGAEVTIPLVFGQYVNLVTKAGDR